MRVQPRTGRDWVRIAAWLLAAAFFIAGAALRSPGLALIAVALAPLLIALTRRRKAPPAPGALYTASADCLLANGRRRAGQLSLTATSLVWTPTAYASRRGSEPLAVEGAALRTVELRRGPGLTDVVVTLTPADGDAVTLLTHSSRRLEEELARLLGATP